MSFVFVFVSAVLLLAPCAIAGDSKPLQVKITFINNFTSTVTPPPSGYGCGPILGGNITSGSLAPIKPGHSLSLALGTLIPNGDSIAFVCTFYTNNQPQWFFAVEQTTQLAYPAVEVQGDASFTPSTGAAVITINS